MNRIYLGRVMSKFRKSSGWVLVIIENEHKQFDDEVAYVVGPFATYEAAQNFAEDDSHCQDGAFQSTFLDPAPAMEKV